MNDENIMLSEQRERGSNLTTDSTEKRATDGRTATGGTNPQKKGISKRLLIIGGILLGIIIIGGGCKIISNQMTGSHVGYDGRNL
jgi:hypothetical protein